MTKPIVEYDITVTQGLPFRQSFTWQQASGSPVDLSSIVSARAEVRPKTGDSHLIVAFATDPTPDEGLIELGGEDGTVVMRLAEPLTWAVRRTGVYDLYLYQEDVDAPPVKFAAGRQLLVASVTRRVSA